MIKITIEKMVNNMTASGGRLLAVSSGVIVEELTSVVFDLRWMIGLIIVLIVFDFWYGISASLKRKEHFRFSRAGRRTCNKFVDYLGYLIIGTYLGLAIFEPLGWATHITTAAVGLGFGCVWEIDSIVGHVCELHGIRNRFSVKRAIIALIKKKDEDLGEAVEEGFGEKK